MNYHIEKLNEQTWLIEEYSNTARAYMYLLTGREKIWNDPTEINM